MHRPGITLVLALVLASGLAGGCVSRPAASTTTPPPADTAAAPPVRRAGPPAPGIVRLDENIALLIGAGGNVVVSIGEDGTFLVDDQVAPAASVLRAVVDSLDPRGVRFVLNTHWHDDHTGGNETFARGRAAIVAHENVRRRMSVDQFIAELGDTVEAAPKAALPVVTFTEGVWFHLNGDNIEVRHLPHAHTDGDAIVRWTERNVIHTGDIYFNGSYPFIDLSSGGSLDGTIAAVDTILTMTNEFTRIVPGHGTLSNAEQLRAYRAMLVAVRDRLRKEIAAKRSADEVVAAGITSEWDAAWGQGFMKPEQFVRIAYESVQRSGVPPARAKRVR